MGRFKGQDKRSYGGGVKSVIAICRANAEAARTKSESDRQAMRARFPFAASIVAELVADKSHPELPAFKPKVIAMTEGGHSWQRNASR